MFECEPDLYGCKYNKYWTKKAFGTEIFVNFAPNFALSGDQRKDCTNTYK